jgi:hypothetical protein
MIGTPWVYAWMMFYTTFYGLKSARRRSLTSGRRTAEDEPASSFQI